MPFLAASLAIGLVPASCGGRSVRSMTTTKRIVGTGLAAGVIGLSGLAVAAARISSEAPVAQERCAEAVRTWPMGDTPLPEGCGCDEEALAAAIRDEPPVVLVDPDGSTRTLHAGGPWPGGFISPAMVEACPVLPAMSERAGGY